MNMYELADLIDEQMKKAKVVLSYQDDKISITFENASIGTYGFVIYEMLSDIAEKHPEMISVLKYACHIFLEDVRCKDETI